MKNKEKVIDNLPELLYGSCAYDTEYCPPENDCAFGYDADKKNCFKCINAWLELEVVE